MDADNPYNEFEEQPDPRNEFHQQRNQQPPVSYNDSTTPPQGSPNTPIGTSLTTPQQQNVYQELVDANARLLHENNNMGLHLKQLMEEMKQLKERLPSA